MDTKSQVMRNGNMDTKGETNLTVSPSSSTQETPEAGSVHNQFSWWPRSWAEALSIETGGIQRVTEEDRRYNTTHVWNSCTFWLSANMAVATLSTGMTGPSLGLNFYDALAIIVVVNLLACMLPAWTATFGLTGLRMTTFS